MTTDKQSPSLLAGGYNAMIAAEQHLRAAVEAVNLARSIVGATDAVVIEEYAAVVAERDALRAIVDGLTTPPTDAQIMALADASGYALVNSGGLITLRWLGDARALHHTRLDAQHPPKDADLWLAFDWYGRPRAWPVAGVKP